ncbi:MAG: DUF6717 family protein [Dehalogenimonas sp.]|uniref:DUF6717 family protein n=1 Tax=Candidatus Dehalogenimonas loeffleri TaxID=3127115 RepID=A0ABZ2J6B8_9CHLR|nr:DUF6717 family protein [Dehalogenimonas sp.]
MLNSIMVIYPYLYYGTWVFDDDRVGLVQEPFVSGIPKMINELVKDIPDAERGFKMFFSANLFPGHQAKLEWVREENGGNWYREFGKTDEGWLCPALFKYFAEAPNYIYIRAEK